MTIRQRVALSALLTIPLSVNAPAVQQDGGPPRVIAADHGFALGYITSGDSYGWVWTSAFSTITSVTCAVAFATPPGTVACILSAAA